MNVVPTDTAAPLAGCEGNSEHLAALVELRDVLNRRLGEARTRRRDAQTRFLWNAHSEAEGAISELVVVINHLNCLIDEGPRGANGPGCAARAAALEPCSAIASSTEGAGVRCGPPPDRIWLQWHGDGPADDGDVRHDDVTWCADQIFDSDVEYVRISDGANVDKSL